MSKTGAHSRSSLPFQEITTKLSSDELVKRLKVVCHSTEKQDLFHLVSTSNKYRIGTSPGLSSEYLANTASCVLYCNQWLVVLAGMLQVPSGDGGPRGHHSHAPRVSVGRPGGVVCAASQDEGGETAGCVLHR